MMNIQREPLLITVTEMFTEQSQRQCKSTFLHTGDIFLKIFK